MQKISDIFLLTPLMGSSKLLKQLKIFQKEIFFQDEKIYSGFLGLNLKRIKAVAILLHFKNSGVKCLNIPVEYRDDKLISKDDAWKIAKNSRQGAEIIGALSREGDSENPMFFSFQMSCSNDGKNLEGRNIITIDALDGHVWEEEEIIEYMYDYNNVI